MKKILVYIKQGPPEFITRWSTVIALIVSSIALFLYIAEFTQAPDLRLQANSSYPPKFNEENFSEPLELILSVNNKGSADAHNLFLTIIFANNIDVELDANGETRHGNLDYIYYTDKWKSAETKNSLNKLFTFKEKDFFAPKSGFSKSIGRFELKIPKTNETKIQIAGVHFDGDFERKAYIIYYDYSSEKFLTEQYTDMAEYATAWRG